MPAWFYESLRRLARPFLGRGLGNVPPFRWAARWYRRSYQPESVAIADGRLYLNPKDRMLTPHLILHREFEPMETAAIVERVRPGMLVLDIGANVGYHSLLLSRQVGSTGRVIAFEPDPENFGYLQQSVGSLPLANVELVNAAVWNRSGTIELYRNAEHPGDHQIYPSDEAREHLTVQTVAVDDVIGDADVDFVKMDIQGAEGGAVEGMQRLLERRPPATMLMEFWPSGLRTAGTDPEALYRYLHGLGYAIHRCDDERRVIVPIRFEEIERTCDLDWKFVSLLCSLQ